MTIRTYLDVRFDVTDLNEYQRSKLAMEVGVQAEATDDDSYMNEETGETILVLGKPDVPYPEFEWNEVEDEEPEDWAVGKIGGGMIRATSYVEAVAMITGIELVDPEGVQKGLYYIDPPADEDAVEGPGETSIYSNKLS